MAHFTFYVEFKQFLLFFWICWCYCYAHALFSDWFENANFCCCCCCRFVLYFSFSSITHYFSAVLQRIWSYFRFSSSHFYRRHYVSFFVRSEETKSTHNNLKKKQTNISVVMDNFYIWCLTVVCLDDGVGSFSIYLFSLQEHLCKIRRKWKLSNTISLIFISVYYI